MTVGAWVELGTAVGSCSIAVGVVVRQAINERKTPQVHEAQAGQAKAEEDHLRATIVEMSRETNRDRDYRIWQLEQYYDRQVVPWSRRFIAQFERVVNLLRKEIETHGGEMPDIEMPILPELPEPPHG